MNAFAKALQLNQDNQFYLLNGAQDDKQSQSYFDTLTDKITSALPGKADTVIDQLHKTLLERQEQSDNQAIYVFASNFQRFRNLQKKDDFSWDETEKSSADKLEELIQLGPENHIHFFIHCDSFSSYLRILSNKRLQDFDYRLLSQMSQTDSLSCIDKSDAAKLELHSALLYQDHNGLVKKFRPHALASIDFYKELISQ